MNCVTTNVELKDNQAQIRDIGVNGFLVRGGQSYTGYSWILR